MGTPSRVSLFIEFDCLIIVLFISGLHGFRVVHRHHEVHFSRMRIALPRNIVLEQHDNDLPIHFKVNRGTPSLSVALDFSV